MPKKKHRRTSGRQSHRNAPSPGEQGRRRERDLQALLAQFALWRRESVPQHQADDEASHVEPLLRLKAEQLESPDPTFWTEELIEVLLTEVAPRKIIQPREMAMEQGPALSQFFEFLDSQQRWHSQSLEVGDARQVVDELEFDVLEAADDPSARSFSGNLLTYAATLGIGPERPEEFEAFVQWYNTALTDAERHEVSDTGRLANPTIPFDSFDPADRPGAGASGPGAVPTGGSAFFPDAGMAPDPIPAEEDSASWPWFLPERSAVGESLDAMFDDDAPVAEVSAAGAEVLLVKRAERLLGFIGEGRPVTATGALKPADVRCLIDDWGIEPGPDKVTTMWQVDEIVGPWTALVSGGWIETTSTRVLPSSDPIAVFAEEAVDPALFAEFAHAVMVVLLIAIAKEDPKQGGMRGGEDTHAALLFAGGPLGLTLPDPFTHRTGTARPRPGARVPSTDEESRHLMRVLSDLNRLARYGLLRHEEYADGGSYTHGNSATLGAVVAMVDILRRLAG